MGREDSALVRQQQHAKNRNTSLVQSPRGNSKQTSSRARHYPVQPAPVAYLRSLFDLAGGSKEILNGNLTSFSKPTQENIEAYSLDAVKAIRDRDEGKLREMLSQGISLNACNRFGESLMHMACRRGDEAIVRLLLFEGNVRLDVRDDFGRTPLHDACWTSEANFPVLDLLLKSCPPDLLLAEDVRGHTPFHYARKEHWDAWVEFLEERKDQLISAISAYYAVVG